MKRNAIFILAACVLVAIISGKFYFGSTKKLHVDSEKTVVSFQKDIKKLNSFWVHIHAARARLEMNDFDSAKYEYDLAIKNSRSQGDIWMTRALIQKMYELKGDTRRAITELDWLMTNTTRKDVIQKLQLNRASLLDKQAESVHET